MRKYKLVSTILFIVIIAISINVYADKNSLDYKKGYDDGIQKGRRDGTSTGKSDARDKTNTMKRVIESNLRDYRREFNINGKSQDYIDGFEEAYEDEFEEAYYTAYRLENGQDTIIIYGAEDFGTIMGRIDGYIAYKDGKKNDWERYIPSDRKIKDMFELDKELREYRDGFIDLFKKAYKLSFEAAFQVAKLGEDDYSYEKGLEDGDAYAKDLATINGRRDYLLGRRNDYTRNMPSNREIVDMFNLNNESREYREAFLAGFEFGQSKSGGKIDGGYMIYYNDAFRKANKETIETPDLNGEEGGRAIGKMKGEYAAIIDVTLGKTNSWEIHKVSDSSISREYGLDFQSDNYRLGFIIGYWDEFMKSYNETYKKLQQDNNKVRTYTEKISIDGKNNIGIPEDDKFLVDIEAGTYYNDVIVTIDSIPTSYINPNSTRHTQASGVYGLKIMNVAGTFDKNKKITIKFKSYGNDIKYGIYKYHYNNWIYIPSKQEGDYLVADINLNNINRFGNIYAVRVDNKLPIFHESRGHWAKDEINTYVKREIIYGYPDKSFKPDNTISRGEFVTMLSRLYNWYPPYDSTNITKFKDYNKFGYAEKAISYATYYKLVNGYADNTFRPNAPITYKEVEIIMSRILNDRNFKWDYFANKMLYEKKVRSNSKDSMNNRITRAEFTYLLYQLNEWQY